ncbi:TniQ family protein [Inquilinus sp. CAU 1745]|uniref:TniQ family protein n=1 Tax=Inquilinus sp. CAU 1745 TaxID=3140369 RepID=UPI00325AD140
MGLLDSKNIPRLPIRCEPIPGESFNGFIARLAEANLFDKVSWVAEVAKVRFPQVWYSDDDIERFSRVAGIEFSALRAMAPNQPRQKRDVSVSTSLGHDVPVDLFARNVRRVCPRCLQESPHHRAIWDLRFVRSCMDHGNRLLAGCPQCGRFLDWRTRSVQLCNCNFPLTDEDLSTWMPPVPVGTIKGPRYLQAMLHGIEQPIPNLLVGLDFDETYDLLWRFGYFGSNRSTFNLDDSVKPEVEIWLTRGLELLSKEAMDLQRILMRRATSTRGGAKKKEFALLTKVQAALKEMSPRAAPLEEVVGAVLSGLVSPEGNSTREVVV